VVLGPWGVLSPWGVLGPWKTLGLWDKDADADNKEEAVDGGSDSDDCSGG
jgi:hypothetical protein